MNKKSKLGKKQRSSVNGKVRVKNKNKKTKTKTKMIHTKEVTYEMVTSRRTKEGREPSDNISRKPWTLTRKKRRNEEGNQEGKKKEKRRKRQNNRNKSERRKIIKRK